jgi:hypothetical protein
MNAIVPQSQTSLSTGLMPTSMDGAMQLAKLMATADLVPIHLQGKPGNCLLIVEQAMRWKMSPFAVAQATGIVKGKLSYEGKLVAAAIQTSGVLDGRLDYEFTGEGKDLAVVVSGRIRGETKTRTVTVTLASAKTDNGWWAKTPEQMLTYHGARVWARRHTPEVMLGVYSPEEFDEHQTREPTPYTAGPTIEAKAEPARTQATKQTLGQSIDDEIPDFDAPQEKKAVSAPDFDKMLEAFAYDVAVLQSKEAFDDISKRARGFFKLLEEAGKDDLKEQAVQHISDARTRFYDTTPAAA